MKEELMQFLIDYAWDHHIGLELGPYRPTFKPCAIPEKRLVIVNTNWKDKNEVPFAFAHELGHIMNGDTGIRYYDSATIQCKSEYQANVFGVKLLLNFCSQHDLAFTNPVKLCEVFGIPMQLDYVTSLLMNHMEIKHEEN